MPHNITPPDINRAPPAPRPEPRETAPPPAPERQPEAPPENPVIRSNEVDLEG